MAASFVLTRKAQKDVSDGVNWYDRQAPGLGDEFLLCVQQRIQSICNSPKVHQIFYRDFRRAVVHRFPYVVFYKFDETANLVTIRSVFHASQNPDKWKRRLG